MDQNDERKNPQKSHNEWTEIHLVTIRRIVQLEKEKEDVQKEKEKLQEEKEKLQEEKEKLQEEKEKLLEKVKLQEEQMERECEIEVVREESVAL